MTLECGAVPAEWQGTVPALLCLFKKSAFSGIARVAACFAFSSLVNVEAAVRWLLGLKQIGPRHTDLRPRLPLNADENSSQWRSTCPSWGAAPPEAAE